jgi:hypothetical protein
MKKPGEWIASLSANLEVSRVDVEANEVLDLIEVTEIDRLTGRPSSVRFFDRVEGARLRQALGEALDVLERSAIESPPFDQGAHESAADPPPTPPAGP